MTAPTPTTQAEASIVGRSTEAEARDRARAIRSAVTHVWRLLVEARERHDWEALGYPSWKAYVEGEFAMTRARSYQLLHHGRITRGIEASTMVDTLPNERQSRELAGLDDDEATAIWTKLVQDTDGNVTAEQVRQRVRVVKGGGELPAAGPGLNVDGERVPRTRVRSAFASEVRRWFDRVTEETDPDDDARAELYRLRDAIDALLL